MILRSSKRICLYCAKKVDGTLRCTQCRAALYCNSDCQEKHWHAHKNNCQNSNSAEDSDEKLHMKAENHAKQG